MFTGNGNHLGANLAFTKFIFVTAARDDEDTRARMRTAGGIVARGFFNDFEAEGGREASAQETIQFLVSDQPRRGPGLAGAGYALQVSSKYRPRLEETESELRRRLLGAATLEALDGAARAPLYTSAAMFAYAFKNASPGGSGRTQRNVIIIPLRKTPEWWEKTALERHTYFYPHADAVTGGRVDGHARAAEAGIGTIHRRLYHNPDGYGRTDEFDFITYFQCA